MMHIKMKDFDYAIKILKVSKKKEYEVRDIAATNLYFMSFIEIHFNLAEDYADIYVKTSRYNTKGLVDKGK